MKNCDEMVNSLLERREQYQTEQKRKKKSAMRITSAACCFAFAALVGVGGWQSGWFDRTPSAALDDSTVIGEQDYFDDANKGQANNATASSVSSVGNSEFSSRIDSNGLIDVIGMVVIDGVTYVQFDTDAEAYTPDVCLGAASDFEGTYQTYFDITPANKLYTTKEDPNILIVKLENGGVVALGKEKQ